MRRRKLIKSIVCVILFLAIVCVVFISQIQLEKERYRPTQEYALTSDIKDRICQITSDNPIEVIKASNDLCCDLLSFSAKNDIPNGKANCVGYAQLSSAIINYAFNLNEIPYKARPVVGQVCCFGINLTALSQKILPKKHRSFFKDHDFVEVDLGNKIIYTDSSLQDLIGWKVIEIKESA
ncbi:hypothetical protein [uncultured Duncaniella sp.]|uniref:hypothetical protein n=1 Tax=uncultured Duncaniella sp. TaxID=2768039 RepID=UPI0032200202